MKLFLSNYSSTMFLYFLLIFLTSQCQVTICRGVENDSVQEEIAQLRAQIKELTSTVENGKKREDELVKKVEGLAMKEEETAKKLYGLSIKDEERTKRVESLAAEVHEHHKEGEETARKVYGLTIREEDMAKEFERLIKKEEETAKMVGGLATEIKENQEKNKEIVKKVQENDKKVGDATKNLEVLVAEVKENDKNDEKMVKKVDALTLQVEENHKQDEKTANNVEGLAKEVEENHKKVEGLTTKVEENDKKDEKTAKNVESLTKEVEENHKKDTETATKVEGLSTNINEYCSMLPKDICGPCQCKDDRRLQKQYFCNCQHLPIKRDCLQYHKEGFRIDGLYRVHQNSLKVIQVHCDQTTDQGGWTVFQRRLDGSVKFYRNWDSYKRGFGELQHEFWLGNDNLFTMSVQGLAPAGNQLRIDMEDWEGNKKFAKYNSFQVANEKRNYQMYLSDYSGTAGDGGNGMSYHNSMKFSTFDRDNDNWSDDNCALTRLGGWWYNACVEVNANGKYYDYPKWGPSESGVEWWTFHSSSAYSLKYIEMKMRRKG